ncbi:MAG TPA: pyridoxal-phosphate dependent enzyme [Niabella sp.]|nr:pyridoxal-phosphate dependent enzyme [Chitinophagaceae bacterium]HRO85043.1 pyridoxal-phosphate dependent enzyme [Niabella sp.]
MQTVDEKLITIDFIPFLSRNKVSVSVLRTDKIHPVISGNKWFKLKYYLEDAKLQNKKRIITFGGAYSNHIVATAAACNMNGFESVGIIRGEEPRNYSHTLNDAMAYGMELVFLSRQDYQNKVIPKDLMAADDYVIAEGGYGALGAAGAATVNYDRTGYDFVMAAVGTGTWMAGLINGKNPKSEVIGISAMKNNYELEKQVSDLLINKEKVNIVHDFHFGGYAKYTDELIGFMNDFYNHTEIPTDFVYTGKLFYGVNKLIEKNYFKPDSRILIIHCGGLQGNLSLPESTLIF